MYIIKKYSASGTWEGQAVETFDALADAEYMLKRIRKLRYESGYYVSLSPDGKSLEVSHDDQADSYTYIIVENRKAA